MKEFAVSIVTPVYNVANYLDEMVRSILRQDIGFRRNVQLVLVDDGSTDGSGALCDAWAKRFPDNIAVLHQENQRQAAARKNGLALATGRFVNFCDPDDILSRNACRRAAEMLDAHPDVDMATLSVRFFGASNEEHRLNAKFRKGPRVLDLLKEPESVTILLATSFFRREALSGFGADTALPVSEDSKETLRVLLRNPRVCLVADATYFYRKHAASTMASWTLDKAAWTASLEHYNEWAVAESERLHGRVLPFVWHTMLFDLSWHFGPIPDGVMPDDERKAYRSRMLGLCRRMDDDVLLDNAWLNANRKSFLLARKRAEPPRLVRDGLRAFRLETSDGLLLPCRAAFCKVFKLEAVPDGLRVFAQVETPAFAGLPPCELVARVGRKETVFSRTGEFFDSLCADEPLLRSFQAEAQLPFKGRGPLKAEFLVRFEGCAAALPVAVSFVGAAPVRENLPGSFFSFRHAGRAFVLRPEKNGFSVKPRSWAGRLFDELRFDASLLLTLNPGKITIVPYRWLFRLLRPFASERTWLLVDRPMHASGDAFELFRYLAAHRRELGVRPKYVLHPKSADWRKARAVGRVVPFTPFRYGLASLFSGWTVSSRTESAILRPFRERQYLCGDLASGHRLALFPNEDAQVRPADRYSRMAADPALYLTLSDAARDEALRDRFYGYGAGMAAATGFPRFDGLAEAGGGNGGGELRTILFAPAWRPVLFGTRKQDVDETPLRPGFKESAWFRGLRDALLSGELLSAARERGFRIRLMPHAEFAPALARFAFGPDIDVVSPFDGRGDALSSAAACVTDDPDVAAECAFLRRPVFFFRPDGTPPPADEDLGPVGRLSPALGPACATREELVARLVSAMRDGFPLEEPYRSRMESFVAFRDSSSSKRAAAAILAADPRARREGAANPQQQGKNQP